MDANAKVTAQHKGGVESQPALGLPLSARQERTCHYLFPWLLYETKGHNPFTLLSF